MKLDADMIGHYIAVVKTALNDIICLGMILAGLAILWFIG